MARLALAFAAALALWAATAAAATATATATATALDRLAGSHSRQLQAATPWWKPQRYNPDGSLLRFQYQLSDSGTIPVVPGVQVGAGPPLCSHWYRTGHAQLVQRRGNTTHAYTPRHPGQQTSTPV